MRAWSWLRLSCLSAVLAFGIVGASLIAWRASSQPPIVEQGDGYCADQLQAHSAERFGVSNPYLRAGDTVTVLTVQPVAWSGASVHFWAAPVDAGSGGTGAPGHADPPSNAPHRQAAAGVVIPVDGTGPCSGPAEAPSP